MTVGVLCSMTGEIIMGVAYGIDVTSQDDPYIVMAENAMTSFAVAGNAGASLGKSDILYLLTS